MCGRKHRLGAADHYTAHDDNVTLAALRRLRTPYTNDSLRVAYAAYAHDATIEGYIERVFAAPQERSRAYARSQLQTLGKVSATVMGEVLTPTLIVLQINSRHLMAQIATAFFRDQATPSGQK